MRKTTILGLLLATTVALGCGAGTTDTAGSGAAGGNASGEDDAGQDDKKEPAKTAKLGDKVRDGKFEFTVKSAKCGTAKVGNDLLGEKAQASSAWSRST